MDCESSSLSTVDPSTRKLVILDLPNEVLHKILSFLPDPSSADSQVWYEDEDGKLLKVSQPLLLRSVSRRFRTIVYELDFWYDYQFTFADLANPGYSVSVFTRNRQEEQLLKVLFTDADLVHSLGRKREWKFTGLGGLMAVLKGIPMFRQNVRKIDLEMLDDETPRHESEPSPPNIAIEKLATCHHVTTLSLHLTDNVDLDAIAISFPSLEVLYFSQSLEYSGSLHNFNSLRIVSVESWSIDISTMSTFLPLNCSETLTELAIEGGKISNPAFDTRPLDTFVNLKSLAIDPLCDSICDYIVRAQIHLHSFQTSLIRRYVSVDKFFNMIHAQSLRTVKEFGLTNIHDRDAPHGNEEYWKLIIDAVSCTLVSVEELILVAPLRTSWCPFFTRMRALTLLNWDITELYEDGNTQRRQLRQVGSDEVRVRAAFEKAFVHFVVKPYLAIRVR
jgi:hypothetical protein